MDSFRRMNPLSLSTVSFDYLTESALIESPAIESIALAAESRTAAAESRALASESRAATSLASHDTNDTEAVSATAATTAKTNFFIIFFFALSY